MCVVKSPKVQTTEQREKEPTVIRNTYLDGLDPATKALRTGRSSLRIERAGASTAQPMPPQSAPATDIKSWANQQLATGTMFNGQKVGVFDKLILNKFAS